jgi:hypothetical protein
LMAEASGRVNTPGCVPLAWQRRGPFLVGVGPCAYPGHPQRGAPTNTPGRDAGSLPTPVAPAFPRPAGYSSVGPAFCRSHLVFSGVSHLEPIEGACLSLVGTCTKTFTAAGNGCYNIISS